MLADLPKHFGTAAFAACVAEKYPSNSDVALASSRTRRSVLRMTPPFSTDRATRSGSYVVTALLSPLVLGVKGRGAGKRSRACGIYDWGMPKDSFSFDIVSEVPMSEVTNALDQA